MHAPETDEECQAWDILEMSIGQMRVHPMGGVLGLDIQAAITLSDLMGYDTPTVAEILCDAESTIVSAINTKTDSEP